MKKSLIEGIKFNKTNNNFDIDWKDDQPDDLLSLKMQRFNKLLSKKKGINYFIAYKLNKTVEQDNRSLLRNSIKYLDSSKIPFNDISLMIKKAIASFNSLDSLSSFDMIITPESTSSLLKELSHQLKSKAGSNTLLVTDLIVKNSIENISVNEEKIKSVPEKTQQIIRKSILNATEDGVFKLKKIQPRYRRYLSNFLSFNSAIEDKVRNSIVDKKILIVDDILTEGTTLIEMNNLLISYGAKELTSFIFLMNK